MDILFEGVGGGEGDIIQPSTVTEPVRDRNRI